MDAMNEVGLDLSRAATSSPMTEVAQRLSCWWRWDAATGARWCGR